MIEKNGFEYEESISREKLFQRIREELDINHPNLQDKTRQHMKMVLEVFMHHDPIILCNSQIRNYLNTKLWFKHKQKPEKIAYREITRSPIKTALDKLEEVGVLVRKGRNYRLLNYVWDGKRTDEWLDKRLETLFGELTKLRKKKRRKKRGRDSV